MLIFFLQAIAALHFFGLLGIIAMLQMDKFDHLKRNLAIALLVTFGSGTGMIVLLEQINPFIWEVEDPKKKKKKGGRGGAGMQQDEAEGGGKGDGDGNGGGEEKEAAAASDGEESGGQPSKAKGTLQDCAKCPEMVTIAGGKFAMGARPDEHGAQPGEMPLIADVKIPSFAIGRFEVTREQYLEFARVMKHPLSATCASASQTGSDLTAAKPGFAVNSWQPMVCVTWNDAVKYTAWLSKASGKTYRLPTASEWEYAARYGNPYPYQNGTRKIDATEARFGLKGVSGPTSIGSFGSNARGLFDLHGNAAEWVEDCLGTTLTGTPKDGKPVIPTSHGCLRVAKGGGWHSPAEQVRLAAREGVPPSKASSGIGFRVARDLE